MLYTRIIIGGGAAGLYCAAAGSIENGLILEKTVRPGQKLLISGSGGCNLTHGGSIKDFISHYGPHGPLIRSALYKHSNLSLIRFFTGQGLELTERSDEKVFPKSSNARDVLDVLLSLSLSNGYKLKTNCPVTSLEVLEDGTFLINCCYRANNVVIASGGCSYPSTGSDGSMFPLLEGLGLRIVPPRPALAPIFVQEYPYENLSGITFREASVTIAGKTVKGDLLLTHRGFSGPAILNLSRYASTGENLTINYCPSAPLDFQIAGNNKQAATFFAETVNLPKRFVEMLLRTSIDPTVKVSTLTGKELTGVKNLLSEDRFSISGLDGFNSAMVTKGGVDLDEVNLKTFESKKYPGLFIIGEALDIDGDTGGYNLQFAYSSGFSAGLYSN